MLVVLVTLMLHTTVVSTQAADPHHPDPYETLHVARDAGVKEIQHAYHDVADAIADEEKLAEVVEAYQEVLDNAYAQEQSLTYEEAPSVNVAVSNDAAYGHVAGGGGYGLHSVGAVTDGSGGGGNLVTGPRLCMVMYKSQRWRWGLRWDSPFSVVGGGEDRGGPFTTKGEYSQDRKVRWLKHYVETRREILYEGIKEGEEIRGNWLEINSGKKGTFVMTRAH